MARRFLRNAWLLAWLFGWVLPLWPVHVAQAGEPVRIAVLAFRPKPQTLLQWQPLAGALKAAIPERDFILQAFTLSELDEAVTRRQVDFVLTNSGHYVLLTRRSGLLAPLATLMVDESGQATTRFGGVMFTRAGEAGLQTLTDIQGKSIVAVSRESLGGYQMQAYALLQAGVDIANAANVAFVGVPQDTVVQRVLDGQADVGFVRTGVLEAMAREGKLDPARVRVLNARNDPSFPVSVSTALFPEWPVSYLPHVDEQLARQVTGALFLIRQDSVAARSMGIRGFSVPADYTPVADMLKTLRVPPFDAAPAFTLLDVTRRYHLPLLILGVALVAIALLGLRLWLTTKRQRLAQMALQRENAARIASEAAIARSRSLLLTVIDNIPIGVFWKGRDLRFLGCNTRFALDSGRSGPEDVIGKNDFDLTRAEQATQYRSDDVELMESGQAKLFYEGQRFDRQGNRRWLRISKAPLRDQDDQIFGVLGVYEDITDRKLAEQRLQLSASVFSHAREGITITEADGTIIDVNDAFTQITGFERNEALGKNPRIMNSGRQDKSFFVGMFAELAVKSHWHGEIWNRRKNGEIYPEMLTISAVRDAGGVLTHYVAMFFDITTIKEHQKQLEYIAHFDALTGLPNRVLLADRLKQAMVQAQRRGQLLAVAYLDLDGFKAINDKHGHDAGDQLLVAVTSQMKQSLREGDTLARLGGDEFVAVLADLSDANDCASSLTRLLGAAAQPFHYEDARLRVSASLGVTFFPQAETMDADQLLRQADQAMYQAKVSGKNRYHVFDAAQDRTVRGLHESLDEIARALDHNEFVLHYQPKINLRSGTLIGAEALIRWQHPVRGLLNPSLFLPVIEDHALAVRLGEWVIEATLSQIQAWQRGGLVLPVSVNLGARQLQQENFVQRLCDLLARHPAVPPALLQMEVLETSALHDLEHTARTISACARLGVNFALDDFGTGYSSLTYLKHLPVTLIKIDQSFVRDMLDDTDDLAILEGVIGLAHTFRRQVIAEGVESVQHATRLLQLGCELAQGNGIAPPMPAADIPAWAARWKPDPAWAQATSLP